MLLVSDSGSFLGIGFIGFRADLVCDLSLTVYREWMVLLLHQLVLRDIT